jgi:hypothetical protein
MRGGAALYRRRGESGSEPGRSLIALIRVNYWCYEVNSLL